MLSSPSLVLFIAELENKLRSRDEKLKLRKWKTFVIVRIVKGCKAKSRIGRAG